MAKPDIKLSYISLALLMVTTTGCADNKPSTDPASQIPQAAQSPQPAISGPALISEKKQRGALLEVLDYSQFTGKKLKKGSIYKVGGIDIVLFSENYEVILDPKQLLSVAARCGVLSSRDKFYLEIAEKVFMPDGRGQMRETDGRISSDGSSVTILMGIEPAFRNASSELDKNFEVDSGKRLQAADNLAVVLFNKSLVTNICSAVIANRLGPEITRQQAEKEAKKAYLISNSFSDQLLKGQTLPVTHITPKQKNPN